MMDTNNNNSHASPLIYTAQEHLLTPEEAELEAKVPTVSSYWGHVKVWFKRYRCPLLLAIVNMVVIGGISYWLPSSVMEHSMKRWQYMDDPTEDEEDKQDETTKAHLKLLDQQIKLILTVGCTVFLALFGLDAYLFFRGARQLEDQVAQHQVLNGHTGTDLDLSEEDSQGTPRPDGFIPSSEESPPSSPASTGFGNDSTNKHHQDRADFVTMSKSVDQAFGCPGESTSATFLVSLLYALFSVAVWNAAVSAGKVLEVQIQPTQNITTTAMCMIRGPFTHDWKRDQQERNQQYGLLSLQQSPDFPNLPQDVQDWILAHEDTMNPPVFNRTLPYLETADGSVVFAFAKSINQAKSWGSMEKRVPGLAIRNATHPNITEYVAETGKSWFGFDSKLYLIGFPSSEPPYDGWCGVFKMGDGCDFVQDQAICYSERLGRLQQYPPMTSGDDQKESFVGGSGIMFGDQGALYANEETLYVANIKTFERGLDFRGNIGSRDTLISLVSYDVTTLEKKLVASRNVTREKVQRRSNYNPNHRTVNPSCKRGYRIGLGVSLPTLLGLSLYLYRLDVPSCALPACLCLAMILNSLLLGGPYASVTMLSLAALCLVVLVSKGDNPSASLWRYVSKEMMVWAMYSLVLGAGWRFFWGGMEFFVDFLFNDEWRQYLLVPFLIFATALSISLLLKHPIFEILAYMFGAVACLSGLSVVNGLRFLIVPVVLSILSLGCFRLGSLVDQYRIHVIVHARRLGRCLRSCCCGLCCGRPSQTVVV